MNDKRVDVAARIADELAACGVKLVASLPDNWLTGVIDTVDRDPRFARAYRGLAKAYAARAARTVCETAIQVHGGIGNTWECLAHVYLRRALLSTDVFGGVDANLARVLEHHQIGEVDGLR